MFDEVLMGTGIEGTGFHLRLYRMWELIVFVELLGWSATGRV